LAAQTIKCRHLSLFQSRSRQEEIKTRRDQESRDEDIKTSRDQETKAVAMEASLFAEMDMQKGQVDPAYGALRRACGSCLQEKKGKDVQ